MGSSLIVCGLITYKSSRPDSEKVWHGIVRIPTNPHATGQRRYCFRGPSGPINPKGPAPE